MLRIANITFALRSAEDCGRTMSNIYNKHYQTEHLFGEPYPALVNFFSTMQKRGNLLDLGCGQGRDSIALAKLGYDVIGIDSAEVGINQLNRIARRDNLSLSGIVGDIYEFSNFKPYEFILLDNIFHFGKRERSKEIKFLEKIFIESISDTIITICLQKTGNKPKILNAILANQRQLELIHTEEFVHQFVDEVSKHHSVTKYQMISLKKS